MEKTIITPEWLNIKEIFEKNTNGSQEYGKNFKIGGELDILTRKFIDKIGQITHRMGFVCVVEDIKMDLWKERIWSLIENAGLLAPIAWKDDLVKDELLAKEIEERTWYNDPEDYDIHLHSNSEVRKYVKTNEVL